MRLHLVATDMEREERKSKQYYFIQRNSMTIKTNLISDTFV